MTDLLIGTSATRVSPVGLGAMALSIQGRPDTGRAEKVIAAFVGGGGTFIDTANSYCLTNDDLGHNERLIRRVLKRLDSRDVIVATKGGVFRPDGEWRIDCHPQSLRTACEGSLQALNTECIALYHLHAVDPRVPLEDSIGELVRLKEEGKVADIGISNVDLGQIKRAAKLTEIASVQNRLNPFDKDDLRNGIVEFCAANGISYIAYSPVGGQNGHVRTESNTVLSYLADKHGHSPYGVAVAWLTSKGVLPICGCSRTATVEDCLTAQGIDLDPADIVAIDAI